MKIEIKNLSLTNFKGIRAMSINLNQVTNVFGDNATGKTTLMDAFLWLLFGKDSTDRKDFEIKTLDANNQPYHRLDHEVCAVLIVDGNEITLRRSFKEKWTKKRGETTAEFSGHETGYFWNDVPMKQEEYQAKISSLLDDKLFKLITNTVYFNSLKWQDRRAVLLQIAGTISDDDVLDAILNAGTPYDFTQLINALKADKSIEEFKKELVAKKKKLKDELLVLPSRISEANLALPEEKDFTEVDAMIETVIADIDNVDGLLMNKSKAVRQHQDAITVKIKEVGTLRQQNTNLEFEEAANVKAAANTREQNIVGKKNILRTKTDEKARFLNEYNKDDEQLKKLVAEKEEQLTKWQIENDKQLVFDDKDFCCPTCKRAYEVNDIEEKKTEFTSNFNADKSKKLHAVNQRGTEIKDTITTLQAKMENTKASGLALKTEIEVLQSDIIILEEEHTRLKADEETQVKNAIKANTVIVANLQKMELLNEEINTPHAEDNSALLQRKKELQLQLDDLKKQLSTKDARTKQLARIKELEEQENKMAQELASLEGVEFSIEQFTKSKMDELESRINGRFKIVRFKMFEEQINGGQVEACTTLINGVPYADANTAAKIQAGLDIINTLSDHYGVQAPVWVDNRESVVSLPETECQLINLIVSAADKKLRIESVKESMVAA